MRSVQLTKRSQNKIITKIKIGSYKGRLIGAEINRNKKINAQESVYKEAVENLKNISKNDLLLIGVALFWAEGNKTGSKFIFSNSDPQMLQLIIRWLTLCFSANKEDIFISIQINHVHVKRKREILKYWSNTLLIDKNNIRGPYFIKIKNKKIYDNAKKYYGVVKIQVKKSSLLQYQILGYIRVLKELYMSG